MSYKKPNTGNYLNDYFTNLGNFYNILPNLKTAARNKDEDSYFLWIEKLDFIDRRSMYLVLLKENLPIPKKYRAFILNKYAKFKNSSMLNSNPVFETEEVEDND